MIDVFTIHFGGKVLVVSAGHPGRRWKTRLSVWQGATENTTVVKGLLEDRSIEDWICGFAAALPGGDRHYSDFGRGGSGSHH